VSTADGLRLRSKTIKDWWQFAFKSTILKKREKCYGYNPFVISEPKLEKYIADLKERYEIVHNSTMSLKSSEKVYYEWLVAALPSQHLMEIAKASAFEKFKVTGGTKVKISDDQEADKILQFSATPPDHPKLRLNIDIGTARLEISDKDRNLSLQ
jgi:hypothetical protein